MAKKKAKAKLVQIKLPVHPNHDVPAEMMLDVVHVEHDKVEPLSEASGVVHCVATLWRPFIGYPYIILAATEGHELPNVSEDGQAVDVQFSPPAAR